MLQVACYNCKSRDSQFYATENGFSLVKCVDCGLLFVNPRPTEEEIEESHKLGVHRGELEFDITGAFNPRKLPVYQEVLQDVFHDGAEWQGKSWLDIGCGHGEFLIALKSFSNDALELKGIEPNVKKQQSARDRGVDVTCFDLDQHDKKYDFVSFLNVYSHLPDPPLVMGAWKNLLKPGGQLFLQTGDTAELKSRDHFRPFYLPDHLSFASEKILVEILERLDFELVCLKKYRFPRPGQYSLIKELAKCFVPNRKSKLKWLVDKNLYAERDMYILAKLQKSI